MPIATRRRRSVPVALLAAVLLLLAACGGGGDDDAAGADDTGGGPRPFTLRYGIISASGEFTGPLGFLHQKGELVPALADARRHRHQGRLVQERAGPQPGPGGRRAGRRQLRRHAGPGRPRRRPADPPDRPGRIDMDAGIVTRKGGAASIADLAGTNVAAQTGSYMHRYLLGALEDEGVEPKEVVHLYVADVEAALERGDIEAAAVPGENVGALRAKGYPVIDTILGDHPDLAGTTATVATERSLEAHPELVDSWQRPSARPMRRSPPTGTPTSTSPCGRAGSRRTWSAPTSGRPVPHRGVHRPRPRPARRHVGVPGRQDFTPEPVDVDESIADGAR